MWTDPMRLPCPMFLPERLYSPSRSIIELVRMKSKKASTCAGRAAVVPVDHSAPQ
jgi:hypothetical protein